MENQIPGSKFTVLYSIVFSTVKIFFIKIENSLGNFWLLPTCYSKIGPGPHSKKHSQYKNLEIFVSIVKFLSNNPYQSVADKEINFGDYDSEKVS